MANYDLTSDHADAVAKAVATADKASTLSRGLFTFFLVTGLYIGVIVSGTSDADLILRSPATLPILNVAVPLEFFFAVAPAIFVIFHFNLLLQLWLLREKLLGLEAALPETARTAYRAQLFPFHFSILAAGLHDAPLTKRLLTSIVAITLFIGPLLLLLFAQAKFLADHHGLMTQYHRGLVTIDFVMLSFFLYGIVPPHWRRLPEGWLRLRHSRPSPFLPVTLGFFLSTSVLFPAYIIFAVPEIPTLKEIAAERTENSTLPSALALTSKAETADDKKGRAGKIMQAIAAPSRWFYHNSNEEDKGLHQWLAGLRRLDAPETRLVAEEAAAEVRATYFLENIKRIDDDDRVPLTAEDLKDYLKPIDLSSRRLDGANLREAQLPFADLRESNLTGADLWFADLTGANLAEAGLTGANLYRATLTGAVLTRADLTGAVLFDADLTGADLYRATLTGADLSDANLTGGRLGHATLTGADFHAADLTGAHLWFADLTGADFHDATLTGADFDGADLTGAKLSGANLTGAHLSGPTGAILIDAEMRCAGFAGALFAPDLNLKSHFILSGASFAAAPPGKAVETDGCRGILSADEVDAAITHLRASPPRWFPDWDFDQGLPPAMIPGNPDALLTEDEKLLLIMRNGNVWSTLPRIACSHENRPAIGPNGERLPIPVCGKGGSVGWYKQWECAQFVRIGKDPWTRDNDPFDATFANCAALATETPQ